MDVDIQAEARFDPRYDTYAISELGQATRKSRSDGYVTKPPMVYSRRNRPIDYDVPVVPSKYDTGKNNVAVQHHAALTGDDEPQHDFQAKRIDQATGF